ncbi:DUF2625 domain-containing protein [Hymenobacter tibetensis]|uniref:DUF2625 domain-containing protein n=1 Tax=Hymenobacter tibetensis TaxID=497967 RepID=A0ABY4CS34_9BACT|nr:DUF2625 domain-containing protein [Hymenobacter tibetensis]UOG73055.1 DUF2625 domain-containing protein [Hymenobacter tibetensis]
MAQSSKPMRPLSELLNTQDSGWPLVLGWQKHAKNKVEILPRDAAKAPTALLQTQVTTRSPMGAIVYESGGILVDNGWLRILGSGHDRLNRSLPEWNKGKTFQEYGEAPSYLLVADDVVGGFFAVNGGALGPDLGKLYYFAPDELTWEPLDLSYSQFIEWCFSGDISRFYSSMRWKGWQQETSQLNGNTGLSFYPFLWTKEGAVETSSRQPVPVAELWTFQMDAAQRQKPSEEK